MTKNLGASTDETPEESWEVPNEGGQEGYRRIAYGKYDIETAEGRKSAIAEYKSQYSDSILSQVIEKSNTEEFLPLAEDILASVGINPTSISIEGITGYTVEYIPPMHLDDSNWSAEACIYCKPVTSVIYTYRDSQGKTHRNVTETCVIDIPVYVYADIPYELQAIN